MEVQTGASSSSAEPQKKAQVPELAHVTGRIRLQVQGQNKATLVVKGGEMQLDRSEGPVDATISLLNDSDLEAFLGGKLNPVVATLKNTLEFSGDLPLAAKVLLKIQGHSLSGEKTKSAEV
jgi:putative sterol carrier protein